jgi:hypothetical protein
MSIRIHPLTACVVLTSFGLMAGACSSAAENPIGTPSGGTSGSAGSGAGAGGGPVNVAGSSVSAGSGGTAPVTTAGAGGMTGGVGGGSSAGDASGGSGGSMAGSATFGGSTTDPGSEGDGKRVVDKPFTAAPEISAPSGVPKGTRLKFVIAKGTSKFHPVCAMPKACDLYATADDREINVYVPMQYVKGTPAPVIVVQDGNQLFGWVDLLSNTLDNLIGAKKLPPIVAVFVNNGGGDAQGSHRGQEYDTLSGVYAEFVDQEVLPRVEQETASKLAAQAVTFTKDPEGRGTLGGSSGGIASFIAGWYHPDLFRRLIGFSPSFVAQESPSNPEHPFGAWNFHEDDHEDDGGIIMKTDPLKPIRVWMTCGTNDYGAGTQNNPNDPYPHYDFAFAIPRAFDKMVKKGYPHVHLDVGTGAGHVDSGLLRATLPTALLWTWRGYQGAL